MSAIVDYQSLNPDRVLSAVDSAGFQTDGRMLEMNSFENRVFQIGLENDQSIVAKFYRPERWSDAAILEEHEYSLQLASQEISLVPPIIDARDQTLHYFEGFRFSLFERQGGRPPDFESHDQLRQLGRFIGRMHAIGQQSAYQHRPTLDATTFGSNCIEFLLENNFIPLELEVAYKSLTDDLLIRIQWCFDRCPGMQPIRVHGDCHRGNILWTDTGAHLVDLDDSRMAPAVQDLWMFLSGSREAQEYDLNILLEGYTGFNEFDAAELHLVEALRTLRLIHYFAWIGRRWSDPAFPRAFPWFDTQRSWEQHILDLREQAALMEEPPLACEI